MNAIIPATQFGIEGIPMELPDLDGILEAAPNEVTSESHENGFDLENSVSKETRHPQS